MDLDMHQEVFLGCNGGQRCVVGGGGGVLIFHMGMRLHYSLVRCSINYVQWH